MACCLPLGSAQNAKAYFGVDRNDYPGDGLLAPLHNQFSYIGYWLSNPPATNHNSWSGKRSIIAARGFGFLILFNGRLQKELAGKDAAGLGRADAAAAAAAAEKEGFRAGAIVFIDQEEGGRLGPEQSSYLFAWISALRGSHYRPGVYCSGIPVAEGSTTITTAAQILSHEGKSPIALWVVNDSNPPAPGCVIPRAPFSVRSSGTAQAAVWQYARSPRTSFAGKGATGYAADQQCYAPGLAHNAQTFVDLNVSSSPDPSKGR